MAVIKFSKADVLRSKNLEADTWYSWEITKIEGPTVSAKGDSYNYKFTLSLIDQSEDLNGKEINRTYNSKAISMMIPIYAAANGKKLDEIDPEAFDVDTDELVGKKVDGKYKLEPYEGNLVGKVEDYLPYKSVAGQPTPF